MKTPKQPSTAHLRSFAPNCLRNKLVLSNNKRHGRLTMRPASSMLTVKCTLTKKLWVLFTPAFPWIRIPLDMVPPFLLATLATIPRMRTKGSPCKSRFRVDDTETHRDALGLAARTSSRVTDRGMPSDYIRKVLVGYYEVPLLKRHHIHCDWPERLKSHCNAISSPFASLVHCG